MLPSCVFRYWCVVCMIPVSVCPPIQPGVVPENSPTGLVIKSLAERGDGSLSEELRLKLCLRP